MFGFFNTNRTTVDTPTSWTYTVEWEIPALEEAEIRHIVRQELADLLPIDVPDTPPE